LSRVVGQGTEELKKGKVYLNGEKEKERRGWVGGKGLV